MKTGPKPRPFLERFFEKVDKNGPVIRPELGPCWVWTASTRSKGYGQIGTVHKGPVLGSHRVAWVIANGEIPEGLFVLHHCDNPPCVRLSHLFVGTNADNVADMRAKGRQFRKLTHREYDHVRGWIGRGYSRHSVAKAYGINVSHVHRIIHRQTPTR